VKEARFLLLICDGGCNIPPKPMLLRFKFLFRSTVRQVPSTSGAIVVLTFSLRALSNLFTTLEKNLSVLLVSSLPSLSLYNYLSS
jgi:hypothetical protein